MMDNHAWYVCSRLEPYAKKKFLFEKENRKKKRILRFFVCSKAKIHFQSVRAHGSLVLFTNTKFNRFSNECVMHLFCIFSTCWK